MHGVQRSSNLELLRILAMFLIVMHHFSLYGPWPALGGEVVSDLSVSYLSFGGKIGVDVFVLISGYFLCKSKFKSMSFLRIILAAWFYAILIPACLNRLGIIHGSLWSAVADGLFPLSGKQYWFVSTYIIMYLLSPFLNCAIERLTIKSFSKIVVIGFLVFSLTPTVFDFSPQYSNLIWFLYIYLCGAYIRVSSSSHEKLGKIATLLNPINLTRAISPWLMLLLTMLAIPLFMLFTYLAIYWYGITLTRDVTWIIAQNTVPILYLSISLFLLFEKVQLPNSRFINAVASTTFGVYLIHENPHVRAWLWPHFEFLYSSGPIGILLGGLCASLVVFVCCSAIDYLRIALLEKPLFKFLRRFCAKPFDFIDNAMTLRTTQEQ